MFLGVSNPIYIAKTASFHKLAVSCANALNLTIRPASSSFLNVGPPNSPGKGILFTMWDSDDLPVELRNFKRFSSLIVPSEHNYKLFRKYFRGPIDICPLFADTTYLHLPPTRPFGFVTVARDDSTNNRKDTDRLPNLFTTAFPTQSDVFLTIKFSPSCLKRWTYDKRINLVYEDYTKEQYDAMLAQHHCGIFLSGAEAWNLPACELAAMGRPSILISLNGPAMFTTSETSWHLPYKLVKAPRAVYRSTGHIGRASDAGIIQAMQEAYSDQLLLAEKAVASARMSHEYTEARFAQRLRDIVRKYA